MAEQDGGLYARRPPSPPLVELTGGTVGHLLCWDQHERDGSWYAWVSWIQSTGHPGHHRHQVVCLRAESVRPIEASVEYHHVPRRTLGSDGQIRPWTPASPKAP